MPGQVRRWRAPARGQYAVLLLLMLVNLLLKAPNLGHPMLKVMDESFHAVVARNVLYDPFKPTLVRESYLKYDPTDWLDNHVWLHKPVLPLWIIAVSFKLIGVNALALRLPSLILSTLAVCLTFLIARRLFGLGTGLVAAAIQAIVPTMGIIVQGLVFSDAIDINLLFWCELSLWLMLLKKRKWIWLSGAAAGAAFMSKTFPALFVIAPLALIVVLRARGTWPHRKAEDGPGGVSATERAIAWTAGGWLIAFLVIALPWNLYCALRFPTEFTAEFGLILTHLSGDVENWASPWDRLWFQHLPSALYLFWTTSLVGSVVLTVRAIQLRRWEWLFVPLWMAAVVIPFTLATSKTPTATLPAWPAFMIAAAFLVCRACRGYVAEGATLVVLLIATIFFAGKFIMMGWGMTRPFEIMRQASWIAWHVVVALGVASIALVFARNVQLARGRAVAAALVVALLVWPTYKTVALSRLVTRMAPTEDVPSQIESRRAPLPTNAVILISSRAPRLRNQVMFYLDRSTYVLPADPAKASQMIHSVRQAGGDVWLFDPFRDRGRHPLTHPDDES